uniref:Uncharacterized protein n=1 Tax=Falco tinnunculus TaxID=100819 RepID=A0A8C4ULS0_FALTI
PTTHCICQQPQTPPSQKPKPLLWTKLSKKCPREVSELTQWLGFKEDQVCNSAEGVCTAFGSTWHTSVCDWCSGGGGVVVLESYRTKRTISTGFRKPEMLGGSCKGKMGCAGSGRERGGSTDGQSGTTGPLKVLFPYRESQSMGCASTS